MKVEEAIRFFEREVEEIEEAEAYAAAKGGLYENLLRAWCYEREAYQLALQALREELARMERRSTDD